MYRLAQIPSFLLGATLLTACAASAPTPVPAPAAPAADAAATDDSRAIHGSTLKPTLPTPPPGFDPNTTVTSGVIVASAAPSLGQLSVQLQGDTLTRDRMGFWNPIAVDPNGGSNGNYGKDAHLYMTIANTPADLTISKLAIQNATTGGSWDTVGYPGHQHIGVYGADDTTYFLPSGSATTNVPSGNTALFNIYADTGNPDTPNNVLRAGDSLNVTVDTNKGQIVANGLKL